MVRREGCSFEEQSEIEGQQQTLEKVLAVTVARGIDEKFRDHLLGNTYALRLRYCG